MTNTDPDRLLLLDRIADRMPDVKLDEQEVEWKTMPDGVEALLVNGGGIDGGTGAFMVNHGDDIHIVARSQHSRRSVRSSSSRTGSASSPASRRTRSPATSPRTSRCNFRHPIAPATRQEGKQVK